MKRALIVLTAVWALMGKDLFAQLPFSIGAGPRIGTTVKHNKFIAGGQLELDMGGFSLSPSFEKVFVKNVNTYNVNIDGRYVIFGEYLAKIFVGGGFVIASQKPDNSGRTTDNGFDIQFGGKANLSALHFFALLRYTRIHRSGDEALVVGVNFGI